MHGLPTFDQVMQIPAITEAVVAPEFIDVNGHMNIRHYLETNAEGVSALVEGAGVTDDYRGRRGLGVFTVEHHLRYFSEMHVGGAMSVHPRVLERSERAAYVMSFLLDRRNERLANILEVVFVHVDMQTRRSTPFSEDVAARFDALVSESAALDWKAPRCGIMGARS